MPDQIDELLAHPVLKATRPVEGVDYYCHRFKTNDMVPPHYGRTLGTKKDLNSIMGKVPFMDRWREGKANLPFKATFDGWCAVPGAKPRKEWGEVCL